LAVDYSQLAFGLSAVSSVAVVAGAVFVVFQLRQNAKLISATIQETIFQFCEAPKKDSSLSVVLSDSQ
jgi:hypothetical protein